ncbi:MAG TPA: Mth938-like domain-containing protein [Candidatus Luteimonas excrementigallinarum]|nr:Mth938-like domain-containing protein [Candidatus Luteimonas excrementigallinarum]
MQLHLDRPDYDYYLRSADGSSALVNERRLTRSFVVAPDALIEDWPVRDAGSLGMPELEQILALSPALVLLGTGPRQVFPPAQIMAACLSRGIGLEAMANDSAARTYHVLAGEGRRVVAAFILD